MKNHFLSLIILLNLVVITTFQSFAHEQRTHQYIVREAYTLLTQFLGRPIPLMQEALGYEDDGGFVSHWPRNNGYPWIDGKIVTGAFREDEEDVMYGYGDGIGDITRYLWASVTHFWNADGGDKLHSELVGRVSTQNTETSKGIIIGVWGGIKLPENNPKTNTGTWGGVYVNMPTGLGWSLQLEYNVWRTILVNRTPEMVVYSPSWNFLIAHKWFFNNTYLKPLIGLGIVSSGESWFGGDRDFLVAFNLAINIGLVLSNEIDGFLQIRKQWAGSLSAGGGASYTPWLIGLGLQIKLN